MRQLAIGLLLVTMLTGCTDTIYYYQKTTVGLDVSASTPEQSGHAVLGYKRRFATIVPEVEKDGEAVSVISCTRLEKEGMFDLAVYEDLATGDAAIAFGDAVGRSGAGQAGNSDFMKCFREGEGG
ncbi:MAG TPA: hypothetical protein DCF61_13755 [Alphaproteobacteria bacterium]|nr:hypothetical protein [Alphaproteobacteria bacterium]HBA43133.1 hypothetical protein [Alphaproteobacteria bacterium]